jgi:hypothetical protein
MNIIKKLINWFNETPDTTSMDKIPGHPPEKSKEISSRPLGRQGNYIHGKSHVKYKGR